MNIFESFKTATVGLTANKVRSALTILGIVIGIASVIVMTSLGQGVHKLIVSQIVSMGSNTIFIEPGAWEKKNQNMMQTAIEEMEIKTLKYEDAKAIAKDPTVELAAAMVMGANRVIYQNVDKKVTFMGIAPEMLEINDTQPVLGRLISENDVQSMARVVFLGNKIAKDLFGEENPLGKTIRIKKINFRVIGVAEEQGMQMFMDLDSNIYVPILTAQKLLMGTDHINWIAVKAKSEKVINEAVENIRVILRERHNIDNPEKDLSKDDFKVVSQVETTEILSTVTGVLTMFLSSIAAIALVVGGIGIMNIMLVSVTERTREVGLRKAVGARNRDILAQFLLEAIILTFFGGLVGVLLGVLGSVGAAKIIQSFGFKNWNLVVPMDSLMLAFGIAVAIGLVFGIYPARKASKLNPIEALRYE